MMLFNCFFFLMKGVRPSYHCSPSRQYVFPFCLLLKYSFYLAFSSLTLLCLCVAFFFFNFILLGVCCDSLMYRLMFFFSNSKKCSATIYLFAHIISFSFWDSSDTYIRLLDIVPQVTDCP